MNITSKIVALSSVVAFALQIALALLMLRYFSPEEVGTFSVISQIGFFWATLALAQSPLRLLANHSASVFSDARHAWVSSLQRFIWLVPISALAVWWSGLPFFNTLLWSLLISLCQMAWMLAQSMRLRMVGVWSQVGVRVLPSLMALIVAFVLLSIKWHGPALLFSALLGYFSGAVWLFHALSSYFKIAHNPPILCITTTSADDRSVALRFGHTLVDVLLATGIVLTWQRLYGVQETGWMTAPLRVMGFVPAVVHMAWVQVLLAQPQKARTNPIYIGFLGFITVAILGVGCLIALEMGWLNNQWQGVRTYLFPLVLWQGSACMASAFSYLQFQRSNSRCYSWLCIGVAGLQGSVLLLPSTHIYVPSAYAHFQIFGIVSSFAYFLIIAIAHRKLKGNPSISQELQK